MSDAKRRNRHGARHLADGLKKTVIAEGIETCRECRTMQALGYRIGRHFERFVRLRAAHAAVADPPLAEGDEVLFRQRLAETVALA